MTWRSRLALAALSLGLLGCDEEPTAWIYYGDSAIGRGIDEVTRIHRCQFNDQTRGGRPAFWYNGTERPHIRQGMVTAIHSYPVETIVNVWLTTGTVDRVFYLRSPGQTARAIEEMADHMLASGADAVYFVTYNDIDDPALPHRTVQDFVDLIDFDSRPLFFLVDLRDLNDVIQGVDDFHYSPTEHLIRAGAAHDRMLDIPCYLGAPQP